jgi:hypothetical protein
MLSDLNPYAPGSGLTPPELAGRQAEIDSFDLLVARTRKPKPQSEHRPARPARRGENGAPSTFPAAGGTSLSNVRQGLIDKGIIFPPERGRVAFTVPGMSSFIRRQMSELSDNA